MNRRSFIDTLAKAAAGFAILPAATTYARNWSGVIVPKHPPNGWIRMADGIVYVWRDNEQHPGAIYIDSRDLFGPWDFVVTDKPHAYDQRRIS